MTGWIKMALDTEVGLSPKDIVLDEDQALLSPKKGAQPLHFLAHVYCSQMDGWMKMPLGREVGLGPSDIVLDRPSSPLQKLGRAPQFLAHMYYGETAGWIKMPLGTQVGLCPGNIMSDADSAPPSSPRGRTPNFWPMSVVAKRLDESRCHLVRMYASAQATLCYMGIQLRPHKGHSPAPNFRPMSIVAKWSPLSYC